MSEKNIKNLKKSDTWLFGTKKEVNMRKKIITAAAVVLALIAVVMLGSSFSRPAQAGSNADGYEALDKSDPIVFGGSFIEYGGETIQLGPKAIYLDGSLSDEVADKYDYVYNDITEALSAKALTNGTESDPMTVYVAPYVYWIHDPKATDTVDKTPGYGSPYGMVVDCEWLSLKGLTKDPAKVVFAANRGQSHGANGNFTMFRFNGNDTGLTVKNLTIGNYCSIDLDYKLKPELNVPRRTSTITQAQIADFSGDKMFADNCNFVSRLNLDPINGGKRSLYNKCHFESTDDAINGNAVFLDCDFDFYGNRPLYSSYNSGSTFLNCQFNCKVMNVETEPMQFFTKEGGPITAVDCVFTSDFDIPFGIAWTKYPSASLKCYQYNILHNGEPIMIAGKDAAETVDMTGKSVLNAYRVEKDGKVYYNTYNLLKGNDDWDPMGVKDIVTEAGAADIPTILTLKADTNVIEAGVNSATVSSRADYFYNTEKDVDVTYYVEEEYKKYVKVTDNGDGTAKVESINDEDEAKKVIVNAKTADGLEAAIEFTAKPSILAAPSFTKNPVIVSDGKGNLKVDYTLDLGSRADQSLISWYRCTDKDGSNPILVAVSRLDNPEYVYQLTAGDAGYYIMAKVAPKHVRSNPGEPVSAVYSEPVKASDVRTINLHTDFHNFPVTKQAEIKPGFWTVDYYRPKDTEVFGKWQGADTETPWVFGEAGNGCVGTGIWQGTQGARLMYTPVEGTYGDMTLKLVVDPAKTAGQGFGSADQYMDVCLKFDTSTLTGYGLRIVRTRAASNACTFVLVKYENGETSFISDEVIASCYMTGCEITLKAEGTKLTAHVETPTAQLADQKESGWVHEVNLAADITPNNFGGVHIQHTGTPGTAGWQNSTMLHDISVEWAGENNQNPVQPQEPTDPENPTDPQEPANPQDPTNPDDTTTPEAPNGSVQTGDASNVLLWSTLSILAILAGGMVLVAYKRKRA